MRPTKRVIGAQLDGELVWHSRCPSQIDMTDGTVLYTRWTQGTDREWIMRQTLSGSVWTWAKAFGVWTDRASLSYAPIIMGG